MSNIVIKNVSKSFDGVEVLHDVNLDLEEGHIYGFIGRNGSGKSVLFKIICGLYYPTTGNVVVDGVDIHKNDVFPDDMRVLIEKPNFLPNLTGLENLKLLASIQNKITEEDIILVLDKLNLKKDMNKLYHKYSLGMKQRLGIGLTLVGDPDLLLLDEPINGLDPQGIVEVRDTVLRLNEERNMTILVSSHILEELSKIATHYGIIHNGSLLQEMTKEELMKRCSERIEICLDEPKRAVPVLDEMGFTNYQIVDKERIHIFERLEESAGLNMELAKAGILVREIRITSEELEDYFLNLTGGASHV